MATSRSLAVTATLALLAVAPAASQTQTPGQFRAGVVLVPLDIRVVDADGNPARDLTAADFTILEDGVAQEIAHFSTSTLGSESLRVDGSPSTIVPVPTHRTFVIVLDRGQLNTTVKAIDALIDFVRTRVLPDDRLSVVAYQRVSHFSTDHSAVARFLQRYRDKHSSIEQAINAPSRAFQLSKEVQAAIAELFDAPGLPRFEELPGAAGMRKAAYLHSAVLVPAIEYIRHLDAEKHVIYVSERALRSTLWAVDPREDYYVRLATGARATLHLIRTGGVTTPAQQMTSSGLVTLRSNDTAFFPADMRVLAQHTGGTSAFYEHADKPLARLDRSTRFQYVLAYYPATIKPDHQFRSIEVKVRRSAVTAQYRHGYAVRPPPGSVEDFRRAFTHKRITDTAAFLQQGRPASAIAVPRSPIRVSATARRSAQAVDLEIKFDASRFSFVQDGDVYITAIDIAVFVDAADKTLLASKTERVELRLNAAEFARLQREWLALDLTVTTDGDPTHARVVMYEYDSDRRLSTRDPIRK